MSSLQRLLRFCAALALLAIVGLVLMGAARLGQLEALEIDWVEVRGPFERVTAEQVRAAAIPLLEDGFLALDPDAVRQSVEKLPWVRSALVGKRWPDTVLISVTEHQPMARWHDGRLVSRSGELFEIDGRYPVNGLPDLAGDEDHAVEIVEFFQAMGEQLSGTGFDIRSLQRSSRGAWRATLSGGVSMELGSDQAMPRLRRFITAWPRIEGHADRRLQRVDLRYAHGFAISWQDQEAAAVPAAGTQ